MDSKNQRRVTRTMSLGKTPTSSNQEKMADTIKTVSTQEKISVSTNVSMLSINPDYKCGSCSSLVSDNDKALIALRNLSILAPHLV